MDDYNSARWNALVKSIFQRLAGVNLGPNMLRSIFVTYLHNDKKGEALGEEMKEQYARAMRHSVVYVSLTTHAHTCKRDTTS